jgi:aspartate racemase
MDGLVDAGADGVVLGCTEIELLVGPDDFERVPLFDTTELHVERAVELSLGRRELPSD